MVTNMDMEKIIMFLLVFLLFAPAAHADESLDIPLGDARWIVARFDNCTQISQETIGPGSVTTIHNTTFHWQNASKITYVNDEGKQDYVIVWQSDMNDEYMFLSELHYLTNHYSDYADDNSVVYLEADDEMAYGIIVDTQNISYSEEELVHQILGKYDYELTNSGYHYNPPIDVHDASSPEVPYTSPESDQWHMATNDPDWYYDHYDYGDNGYIDDYLDEYYYW